MSRRKKQKASSVSWPAGVVPGALLQIRRNNHTEQVTAAADPHPGGTVMTRTRNGTYMKVRPDQIVTVTAAPTPPPRSVSAAVHLAMLGSMGPFVVSR